MTLSADYKTIFTDLPLPAAVCTPVYDKDNAIKDIHIDLVNDRLLAMTKQAVRSNVLLSAIRDSLTPDIDWLAFAEQSLSQTVEKSFYSIVAKTHLKITAVKNTENLITVCLTDISREKETEQQLRRQNTRLEELTEQLEKRG